MQSKISFCLNKSIPNTWENPTKWWPSCFWIIRNRTLKRLVFQCAWHSNVGIQSPTLLYSLIKLFDTKISDEIRATNGRYDSVCPSPKSDDEGDLDDSANIQIKMQSSAKPERFTTLPRSKYSKNGLIDKSKFIL